MEDENFSSEILNPGEGNVENENLQNNSGENANPADNRDTTKGKIPGTSETGQETSSSGKRHLKKDNRKISDLKLTQKQKQKKQARFNKEIDTMKSDLDRGYLIVPLGDNSGSVKHVKLNKTDRQIIKAAIEQKKFENYELGLDIGEINQKIIDLASTKKSSYRDKLSKKKNDTAQVGLVKRIGKELENAKSNGSKLIVESIQKQLADGKKNDAYYSLKTFLSQNLKTVSKKLSKSPEMEQIVIDRVLDKLTQSQS